MSPARLFFSSSVLPIILIHLTSLAYWRLTDYRGKLIINTTFTTILQWQGPSNQFQTPEVKFWSNFEHPKKSPEKVLRKCWESPQKVPRKSLENPKKLLRKYPERIQKVITKSSKSNRKFIRKNQKVLRKSLKRPQKDLRKFSESQNIVLKNPSESPKKRLKKS